MQKVLLCIMDGVGIRKETHGNAVFKAKTDNLNRLLDLYPHTLLEASGKFVGLPEGQMGNSEVGHTNIGAGRIVKQPLTYINDQLENFISNPAFNDIFNHVKNNNSKLHILGLLSDGGVHSHINHLYKLLDVVNEKRINNVYLHIFTDGRDTSPTSAVSYIKELKEKYPNISIASISGRYYAMDRDNNWNRTRKCFDVIVNGLGRIKENEINYLKDEYKKGITDEFIKPMLFNKDGIISNNDGLITFNFRPDRLRQIFKSITNSKFNDFPHKKFKNIKLVTMMPVSDEVICENAFNNQTLNNTLGEYISNLGYKQLRIAETEKYAHVTYFFDGGMNKNLNNCDKILIPSPKVATYDLMPEMSAYKITNKLLSIIDNYDFTVLNFANGDMVGHTGVFDATVKAVETVDECIGKLYEHCKNSNITMLITADHGNSEYMLDENNNIITSHTTSKVPLIVTDTNYKLKSGKLSNIAPTILDIMNLNKPKDMEENSLIKE